MLSQSVGEIRRMDRNKKGFGAMADRILRLRLSCLPGTDETGPLEGCRTYLNNLILTRNLNEETELWSRSKVISFEEWKDYDYRVEAPTRIEENPDPDTPMPTAAEMCALVRWLKEQAERDRKNVPFIAWLQRCPPISEENDIVVPIYAEKELPYSSGEAKWENLILCPDCRRGRIGRVLFSSQPDTCGCCERDDSGNFDTARGCGSRFVEKVPSE